MSCDDQLSKSGMTHMFAYIKSFFVVRVIPTRIDPRRVTLALIASHHDRMIARIWMGR